MSQRFPLRRMLIVAVLAAAPACREATSVDPEPRIEYVRVRVGGQAATVSAAGEQTGTLTVPRGASAVTVDWVEADGTGPVHRVGTLHVRMVPQGSTTGVTFASDVIDAGTLTTTSAGEKVVQVQLYHIPEQKIHFAQNLTFTSQ